MQKIHKMRLKIVPLFMPGNLSFIKTVFGLLSLSVLLSACGLVSHTTYEAGRSALPAGMNHIQAELYSAHKQWQGTPYVLGGSDVNGVDCSSFMQIVFDHHFGIEMPRHTSEQLQVGSGVRRTAVRPGDLVFFRTGANTMHVGVIVEADEFLHASTSSGVMISSLGESYWASRYLGARRIL